MLKSIVAIVGLQLVAGTELTFELLQHDKQCFYEEIEAGTESTLEYQVVYGGRLDIDVQIISGVDNFANPMWEEKRSSTGSHSFTAHTAGTYGVCFSNKFSTLAHKTVYFDFVVGNDDPLQDAALQHHETFTQLETSLINTHDALRRVLDMQTHHRMRETTHRYTAEYMNERVQLVSACEALLLIATALFQVIYLRSLFSAKPDRW